MNVPNNILHDFNKHHWAFNNTEKLILKLAINRMFVFYSAEQSGLG